MDLKKVLEGKNKLFFLYIALLGLINGLWNVGLIKLIHSIIDSESEQVFDQYAWLIFFVLAVISFFSIRYFQYYIIELTNEVSLKLETWLMNEIGTANYSNFQKLGKDRIYTALQDIRIFIELPGFFFNNFTSFIIVISAIGYAFWISIPIGLILLLTLTGLFSLFLLRNKKIRMALEEKRDLENNYFTTLNDFLLGFKQIKINAIREINMFRVFTKNRVNARDINNNTSKKYFNNQLLSIYTWYLLIGFSLFIIPMILDITNDQIAIFVIIILYVIDPTESLAQVIPFYTRYSIAQNRLEKLEEQLHEISGTSHLLPDDKPVNEKNFSSIEFKDLIFSYDSGFSLGPVSFKIKKNDITFITGGNGSGKSTLINILTGLYRPTSGKMVFNGKQIETEDDLRWCQNNLSCIFSDHHLFHENYNDFILKQTNKDFIEYLKLVQLEELMIKQNFNTSGNLSRGQEKRIALAISLLEEKDLIILDEFAAPLDPDFKDYLYYELLPLLKQRGKTILLVTHDSQYFNQADQVINLKYGKLVNSKFEIVK